MEQGRALLVHGAAGGVGVVTLQVARAFGAGRVVAVVLTEQKGKVVLRAAADEFGSADGFRDQVLEGGKIDVAIVPVGGSRFVDSLRCPAPGGPAVMVGFAGGVIPKLKVHRLLLNNPELVGASWGPWILGDKGRMAAPVDGSAAARRLTPRFDDVLPLERAADAFTVLDERRAVGKVALRRRARVRTGLVCGRYQSREK